MAGPWRRGAVVGGVAGCLQVTVNHGDTWLRGAVDGTLVAKTVMCLAVALAVGLTAAVWSAGGRRDTVFSSPAKGEG